MTKTVGRPLARRKGDRKTARKEERKTERIPAFAERSVWIAARTKTDVATALEHGFHSIAFVGRVPGGVAKLGRIDLITLNGRRILSGRGEIGRRAEITDKRSQDAALRGLERGNILLVDAKDWKIIPFENLVAAAQEKGAHVYAEVDTAAEADLLFNTLEVGVAGVLMRKTDRRELTRLRSLLDRLEAEDVRLTKARVTSVRKLGMGDRVCVDTCSMMGHGEGLLVGSSSACLFLIHAESIESEYVAARPFRVNAGPVHSYVLVPGGRTRYLSELKSGDDVLLTDKRGRTRHAIVGRVKIERRPMLLLSARAGAGEHSVILQNAETIRLVTDRGTKSVSEIRPGDNVLVRLEEGGRHFGMRVRETIREA